MDAAGDVQAQDAFVRMMMLTDTIAPWAIRAAVTLGIADVLGEDGATFADVEKNVTADPDTLARLLRYMCALGVFAERDGRFHLTPLSRMFAGDGPMSMRSWWDLDGGMARVDQASTLMLDAVRTGRPVYEKLFGRGVWEDFSENPDLGRSFERAMAHKTTIALPAVLAAYPWADAREVVDVGGGHGLLLDAVLEAAPDARGVLFDSAVAVKAASEKLASRRIEFVVGSFFDEWPREADLYVLANVVHNWDDENAVRLLRRGAEACADNGRVLVIETVLGDGGDQRSLARLDMLMLLMCGGRERTWDDYHALAAASGLRIARGHPTTFGLNIIEMVAR